MNILNISPVFPPLWHYGGSVTTSFAMARELAVQGHAMFALTTEARYRSEEHVPISQDTEWDGVPVRYCKMWGPAPPFWSPELRRQVRLRAPHYDIALIKSCWDYVGVAAGKECRRAGAPYLAYPEGSLDPWLFRYSRLKKQLWWRLWGHSFFQGAAAIVANTQADRENIASLGLTNRIEVINNGVNLADFEEAVSREELESHWGILRGKRWLLFIGRLHHKKGLDLLIPSFARVSRQFPDHLLIIAGIDEGGYENTVHQMVKEFGLTDKVIFTGPVYGAIKVRLLKEADAFVLTSYSEGQPMAVIEALGCGAPVLITTPCNVPEVAEAGAGFVVPASIESIVPAFTDILRQDRLRQDMGKRARNLVESRFTWEKVARRNLALFQDILS
ncbi:MAG: glycosyltransferase [Deltaproteobacteria bacterium]|nr:glycosyltransferase [Deltaproteobacteria bacterium]